MNIKENSKYDFQEKFSLRDISATFECILFSVMPSTSGEQMKNEPEPSDNGEAHRVPTPKIETKPTTSAIVRHESHDDVPVEEKIFDANELRNYLLPIWEKLDKQDEAMPFRIPVDPDLLKIPVSCSFLIIFTKVY